ncbi:DUF6701 domain-containing protein [Desulfonatronum parangueonense]
MRSKIKIVQHLFDNAFVLYRVIVIISLMLIFVVTPVAAFAQLELQCSPTNSTKVAINELFTGGGGEGNLEFLELYFNDTADIDGWKIYWYDGNGNQFRDFLLGEGAFSAESYLPDGSRFSDYNCPSTHCSNPTTFPKGTFLVYDLNRISPNRGEFLLVDSLAPLTVGDEVVVNHFFYYKNHNDPNYSSPPEPDGCSLVFEASSNLKDMSRLTDGTGNMYEVYPDGSPVIPTTGSSNMGGSSNPTQFETNVSISKEANVVKASIGQEITYSITVFNRGPMTATGIMVDDHFPFDKLDFVGFTTSYEDLISPFGTFNTETFRWVFGVLPVGAHAELLLRAVVNDNGPITNTATVAIDQTNLGHEVASVTINSALAPCELVFPGGAQNHSEHGFVTFDWKGQITGQQTFLLASMNVQVDPDAYEEWYTGKLTCVSDPCLANGEPSLPIHQPDFRRSLGIYDITIPAWTNTNDYTYAIGSNGSNHYGDLVSLYAGSNAIISDSGLANVYFIDRLSLNYRNTLRLEAGTTYWVDYLEFISTEQNVEVVGDGTATLIINNVNMIPHRSRFNSESLHAPGAPSRLAVFVYNNWPGSDSEIAFSGFLHVNGNFVSGYESRYHGAVSVGGNLHVSGESIINYSKNELQYIEESFCEPQQIVDDPQLNHLRLLHAGQGLTCIPEEITVLACADSDCEDTLDDVEVYLASPANDWSINPIVVSGRDSVVDLSVTEPGLVILDAISNSMPAAMATRCFVDSNETCEMFFSACADGFNCLEQNTLISEGDDIRTGRLFTKITDTEFTFDVVALREDGTREVNFVEDDEYQTLYRDITVQLIDVVNGNAVVHEEVVRFEHTHGGRKALNSINIDRAYRELRCRIIDELNNEYNSTDLFSVRPRYFIVQNPDATADTENGNDSNATLLFKSGSDEFTINAVSVAGYDGQPKINNFEIEAHQGSVRNGEVTGTFSDAYINSGIASGEFQYSEVGYFRFNPYAIYDDEFTIIDHGGDCVTGSFSNEIEDGRYGCNFGNETNSKWFGRFVPDHFFLLPVPISDLRITPGCGDFTYMSNRNEPSQYFVLNFSLEARNGFDIITGNYHGIFGKAEVSIVAENSNDGLDLSDRLNYDFSSYSWEEGQIHIVDENIAFDRSSSPDGPFEELRIGVKVDDDDYGTSKLLGMDMNPSTSYVCIPESDCNAKELDVTKIRYGRLRLVSAHGPENQNLKVPMHFQYFDGKSFVLNNDDSCTTFDGTEIDFRGNEDKDDAWKKENDDLNVGSGKTQASYPTNRPIEQGQLHIDFLAPNSPGHVDICGNIFSTFPWLSFDWGNNGCDAGNPSARATFGVRRSNDRIIFQREVF